MGLTRASIPRATPGRPLTARRGADKRRENRRTGHQVMPMGLARASIPQATPGCQGVATGQITSAGKTVGNIPPLKEGGHRGGAPAPLLQGQDQNRGRLHRWNRNLGIRIRIRIDLWNAQNLAAKRMHGDREWHLAPRALPGGGESSLKHRIARQTSTHLERSWPSACCHPTFAGPPASLPAPAARPTLAVGRHMGKSISLLWICWSHSDRSIRCGTSASSIMHPDSPTTSTNSTGASRRRTASITPGM